MTLHLAKRIKWRDIGACGRWAVDTTKQPSEVTCSTCRKTKLFAMAVSGLFRYQGRLAR